MAGEQARADHRSRTRYDLDLRDGLGETREA
jgi:hypothetical protein